MKCLQVLGDKIATLANYLSDRMCELTGRRMMTDDPEGDLPRVFTATSAGRISIKDKGRDDQLKPLPLTS